MDVKLVMFKRNGARKDFPVKGGAMVIGRGEECELRIPLLSVSRRHCQLTAEGKAAKVKDLASSNGTYVNNRRVNEQELKPGDRLVVGPVVFTVQIDGKPEEIRPVKTRGERLAEGKAKGEEVVELEPDVVAKAVSEGDTEEEIDPIAALEAMASESDENEDETK